MGSSPSLAIGHEQSHGQRGILQRRLREIPHPASTSVGPHNGSVRISMPLATSIWVSDRLPIHIFG